MLGIYGLPGAGWCKTSVFLVLIVIPKLEQADENLSTLFCMSSTVLAFRAQSSAKRKSYGN